MSSTESTTKLDYKNTKYRKTKETQSNYREEKIHTKKKATKKNYIQTTAAVIDCANVIPTYVFSCRTKLEKLLVFEMLRKDEPRELYRVPNHKAPTSGAP